VAPMCPGHPAAQHFRLELGLFLINQLLIGKKRFHPKPKLLIRQCY
jgi:hypothetical protein